MTLHWQPLQPTDHFARLGMVARWRPVHRGHTPVLRALCRRADLALIGIGSANRYNVRNPFTLEETRHMLGLALPEQDNYQLIAVPDLDDGPRWREMILGLFGPLDLFVTDNPYVVKPAVVALARWLDAERGGIPPFILERPPSAELRPDQVDPFDYARMAPALEQVVQAQQSNSVLRRSEHKRWQMGVVLKVSDKAFGSGRLVPISRR